MFTNKTLTVPVSMIFLHMIIFTCLFFNGKIYHNFHAVMLKHKRHKLELLKIWILQSQAAHFISRHMQWKLKPSDNITNLSLWCATTDEQGVECRWWEWKQCSKRNIWGTERRTDGEWSQQSGCSYSVWGTEMAGPLGSSKRSIVRSCMIMCRP